MPAADIPDRRMPWRALLSMALLLALGRHYVTPAVEAPHDPMANACDDASPHAPEGSAETLAQEGATAEAQDPKDGLLWAGCIELGLSPSKNTPTCSLYSDGKPDQATLRVWLPSTVSDPSVTLDGVPVTADTMRVDGGWSLLVEPSHSGRVLVSGLVEHTEVELLSVDVDYRPRPDGELRTRLDHAVGNEEAQRALAKELRTMLDGELPAPQRLLLTRYLH